MTDTVLQKSYREKAVAQQSTLAPVLVHTMAGLMPQIPDLLPPDISVEQFRSAMFLELSGRPTLANCTQTSLRDSVIKAAMYGLLPGRDCHILPFKNRKGGNVQATFVANTPCFEANLRGAMVLERPTVANLADILPVRRRELSALDRARWPLTRGRGEG